MIFQANGYKSLVMIGDGATDLEVRKVLHHRSLEHSPPPPPPST